MARSTFAAVFVYVAHSGSRSSGAMRAHAGVGIGEVRVVKVHVEEERTFRGRAVEKLRYVRVNDRERHRKAARRARRRIPVLTIVPRIEPDIGTAEADVVRRSAERFVLSGKIAYEVAVSLEVVDQRAAVAHAGDAA
jgi:hypothetical protein